MELEIVGRHTLLFDDDDMANFVNSKDALVEWNDLPIDRYDVRHLLSDLPPRKQRYQSVPSSEDMLLEAELDLERYADLPAESSEEEPDVEKDADSRDAGGYSAVPFAYGSTADSTDQKNPEVDTENACFYPPFPVPESLLQSLPPTEKVHQIIARTAIFVSQHGGQSEIVLRVKQGDNPTFGFLMPHHQFHPYFRYLVHNKDLLKGDLDGKAQDVKGADSQAARTRNAGALSLLGSAYDSGDDDDTVAEGAERSRSTESADTSAAIECANIHASERPSISESIRQDNATSILSHASKVKGVVSAKMGSSGAAKAKSSSITGNKRSLGSSDLTADRSKASSVSSTSKAEGLFIEPPSELKRLISRIVEIILKNGKDFEAVLIEQDKQQERFPFLVPSNPYHPYYLKALKQAQVARSSHGPGRSSSLDSISGSADDDLLPDYDRKDKFKMVIGKPKWEQDQPSKSTNEQHGAGVDVAAAAAILQAARRGIKNPNLEFFSKTSINGASHGTRREGGGTSSIGSEDGSQPQSSSHKESIGVQPSPVVPVAKQIAKTAALVAASEADSSEVGLTREEKLKAERRKRAKMFTAMLKSSVPPLGKDPLRGLSAEPTGSGISAFGTEVLNHDGKEREGSSVPDDVVNSDKAEMSEKTKDDDETEEMRSRKKRHYRSKRPDGVEEELEGEEEEEEVEAEQDKEKRDDKRSRKKHRSHHSSRHHRDRSKDKNKHRRRHSSSKRHSRHKHDGDDVSEDDARRHRHKNERSDDEGRHRHRHGHDHRHRKHERDDSSEDERGHSKHKHDSSSEDELRHRKNKHDDSSDDERRHRRYKRDRLSKVEDGREKATRKHRRKSKDMELEEGEIRAKSSDKSQSQSSKGDGAGVEMSLDRLNASVEEPTPPQPPAATTEVPDDLRAKIRAMLLATI